MSPGLTVVVVIVVVLVVAAAVIVLATRRRRQQRAGHPDIGLPDLGALGRDSTVPKGQTRAQERPPSGV